LTSRITWSPAPTRRSCSRQLPRKTSRCSRQMSGCCATHRWSRCFQV